MKKVFASVVALGVAAVAAGCGGGIPGAECKFNKGEIAGGIQGDAKAFVDAAMDLKKTNDALEAEWSAEIKAMGGELKVENPNEENVLAKINVNVKASVDAKCTVSFKADMDAGASGSAGGSAGTGEAAKGGGSGSAHADVKVEFDIKCDAKMAADASVTATVATVKAHFPKLLGISVAYKGLLPKVKATAEAGSKVMGSVKDPMILPEVKCAAEAVTGIKAEARVDFSVKASASAKGEAKAG